MTGQSIKSEMSAQNEVSYACKVMMERGSVMFCGQEGIVNLSPKSTNADILSLNNNSYACNVMAGHSSDMLC